MKKIIVLFLILSTTIFASSNMAKSITIKDGLIRLMPPTMKMSAAFMTISNNSDKEVVIIGASSPLSKVAEIHTHIMKGNKAVMTHLEQLSIKAKSDVLLKKGGHHIMLMGLKHKLKANDKHDITIKFSDGSSKTHTFYVKKL